MCFVGTESLYDVLFVGKKVLFPNFPKDTQSQACLSSHYGCGTHLPPAHNVLTAALYEPRCHTKLSCFQQSATCYKLQTFPSYRIVTLILESLVWRLPFSDQVGAIERGISSWRV